MNKDERASLWFERIKEFRTSGQTCKDWCAEHQIPAATMNYWLRKQKQEESASVHETEPVFAKLPSESEIALRDTAVENAAVNIFVSGTVRIEVAPNCPPELFHVLIRILKEHA